MISLTALRTFNVNGGWTILVCTNHNKMAFFFYESVLLQYIRFYSMCKSGVFNDKYEL